MMNKLVIFLLFAENISALPLACLPSQPVQAVEGGSATLQCRLDPPNDLSSTTVEWNRGHTRYVHVYRSLRDDPDSQMLQYRDRTALNRGDLSRGVSTLTISNVSLSDNGSYEVYLPQWWVRCSTHLTVATKEQEKQTKRKDSSTTSPPAGERNEASNREAGRAAIVPTALLILCVLIVLLVLKSGKIRSCKKEGEPKTSEGDQQSAAEEGLVGSEVADGLLKGQSRQNRPFCIPSQT